MINGKTDIHYNAMPIKEMEQMKNKRNSRYVAYYLCGLRPFFKK